jgi:hypothetical protein
MFMEKFSHLLLRANGELSMHFQGSIIGNMVFMLLIRGKVIQEAMSIVR